MRLLVNMITKNEENRFLAQVLEHTKTFATEIVITDDHSTDNTVVLAEQYGCYVYAASDNVSFVKNEGQLRSEAWHNLELHAEPNTWVLCLDADELLWGYTQLPRLMDQSRHEVLGITFVHDWAPGLIRVDKAWAPNISYRLFKYYPNGEFLQKALASGSEPTYVQELIRQDKMMWHTPLVMEHLGYLHDADKWIKYQRYTELDGGRFHSNAHINSIVDKHPILQAFKGQP